jgi:hypothetical protein
MDLLHPEVLDEASCIVTTFQTLEFNFIGQGQYDYNERYPIFFLLHSSVFATYTTNLSIILPPMPQCKNEKKKNTGNRASNT